MFLFGSEGEGLGQLRNPAGLAFNSKGHLFISEYGNHRIQVFTAEGKPLSVFGKFGRSAGEFDKPADIDIGIDDRLYVVDTGNHRIQIFKIQ